MAHSGSMAWEGVFALSPTHGAHGSSLDAEARPGIAFFRWSPMTYEQTYDSHSIGRRQALCTLAGIATAVAGIGLIGIGTAEASTSAATPAGATVSADEAIRSGEDERAQAMVDALIPATLDVGRWSIERVHAPRLGAIAVVMRTPEGKAFQVDVMRRDDTMPGVATTKHFSLFVANSGSGETSTAEYEARGAKVLAHHLRSRELSGVPLPSLMTFAERADRHPFGAFGVLG